jgi:hypothetical protein
MKISVNCQCGKRLAASPSFAGKRVKCPSCGTVLVVPECNELAAERPVATAGAASDIWDELPALASASHAKSDDTLAAHHAASANKLLEEARTQVIEQKKKEDAWGTGQIISGLATMTFTGLWIGLTLLGGRIPIYSPIMFVTGATAFANGVLQKINRSK